MKPLKYFSKKIANLFGLSLEKTAALEKRISNEKFLEQLLEIYTDSKEEVNQKTPAEVITFSMDRAIQAHALLSSFYEKASRELKVHIFYKANSPEHDRAYSDLQDIFKRKDVNFVKQVSKATFRDQLLEIIKSVKTSRVLFLVDDIIFKEDLDIDDLAKFDPLRYVLSLRMAPSYTRNYTFNVEQKKPEFSKIENNELNRWEWSKGEYDWNYPVSVDGHLFLTKEILFLSENTAFTTPNSYEGNLNSHKRFFVNRYGLCYDKSKIINLPINRVNIDTENLAGSIDPEFLLKKWNEGMQIDYKAVYGFNNISAHQEIPISFTKR